MQLLQQLFGETGARYATWVVTALLLLFVVLILVWLVRKALGDRLNFSERADRRGRPPRLGVTESFTVDRQGRRLVMVRRDNTEHLIMIGGPNDVVIETNIMRAERPVAPRLDAKVDAEIAAAATVAVTTPEVKPAPEPPKPAVTVKTPLPTAKVEEPVLESLKPRVAEPVKPSPPPEPPPVLRADIKPDPLPPLPRVPVLDPKPEPPKPVIPPAPPSLPLPVAAVSPPARALDAMAEQLESLVGKAATPVKAPVAEVPPPPPPPPVPKLPPLPPSAPAPMVAREPVMAPPAPPSPPPAPAPSPPVPPPVPPVSPPKPAPAASPNPFESLEEEMARLLGRTSDGKP